MEINSLSAIQPMKPSQPREPTPPPGGNIENRQPPPEPTKPSEVQKYPDFSVQSALNNRASDLANLIDVFA